MTVETFPKTFGQILDICERRARIVGEVKENDRDLIKGYINEYYVKICTERNWSFRNFDRAFPFPVPTTTGTVAVTNGSREVIFTGLTISNSYLGTSFSVNGESELYRIIGVDTVANSVYLESNYVGTTDALATYKIYHYEFALPPDCDTINQVYIISEYLPGNNGQLEELNLLEFNRMLSLNTSWVDVPRYYTRDGKTYGSLNLPALDEMILNYDFLGGDVQDKSEKLRIFPIEPDQERVIHLSYTVQVSELQDNSDEPIMDLDNRWMLIHFALYEWFKNNGQNTLAEKELRDGNNMLKEMRDEWKKGQVKPKVIMHNSRYRRSHNYDDKEDMFRLARAKEYSS